MVAVPPDTPVTSPVGLTVAAPTLLHVPPAGPHVRVMDSPAQTPDGPTIADTVGNGVTVTTVEEAAVPQTLVMV